MRAPHILPCCGVGVEMRFLLLFAWALCFAGVFGGGHAWANLTYTPLTLDGGLRVLVVSGEFTSNDYPSEFVNAVAASNATTVTFDSPGGNVVAAMALGRTIRFLGLNTLQIRQLECASACALAFLGGVTRVAAPGSIGVHRTSFAPHSKVGREEAVASVQVLTAEIISYLSEMGVSTELLSLAMRYDRSDIRYLSASEMAELRVTTSQTAVPDLPASSQRHVSTAPSTSQSLEAVTFEIVKNLIEQDGRDPVAALRTVAVWYADTVSYYGKQRSLSEVLEDKKQYFNRWPERWYHIRDDSVTVTCANGACMVSGIYDWQVSSIPRNKQARGVASFSYTISLGANPKVIAEAGEVLKQLP